MAMDMVVDRVLGLGTAEDAGRASAIHDGSALRRRISRRRRESGAAVSHSHTMQASQPFARSSLTFFSSLALLPAILLVQYPTRLVGARPLRQSWPCQKSNRGQKRPCAGVRRRGRGFQAGSDGVASIGIRVGGATA